MNALAICPHFISLEGGEGAGKTTVMAALRDALVASGERVLATREPGGTPLAESIRALLLGTDATDEPVEAETELLLMFAARVQHVRQVVQPALDRGDWVISDRFTDSSHAYQGGGRGLASSLIAGLERDVVGIRPGLTLLLDVGVDEGRARARGRNDGVDRIEREQDAFFERVRATFLQRAADEPDRIRVIDASRPADVVAADAVAQLLSWRQASGR